MCMTDTDPGPGICILYFIKKAIWTACSDRKFPFRTLQLFVGYTKRKVSEFNSDNDKGCQETSPDIYNQGEKGGGFA